MSRNGCLDMKKHAMLSWLLLFWINPPLPEAAGTGPQSTTIATSNTTTENASYSPLQWSTLGGGTSISPVGSATTRVPNGIKPVPSNPSASTTPRVPHVSPTAYYSTAREDDKTLTEGATTSSRSSLLETDSGNPSTVDTENYQTELQPTASGTSSHDDPHPSTDVPPPDWSHIHAAVIVVTLGIPLLTFAVFIVCRIRVKIITRRRYDQMQKLGNLGLSTISLATSASTLAPRSSPRHCQTYGNTLLPPSALPPPVSSIDVQEDLRT